jgi:hypothetical protein
MTLTWDHELWFPPGSGEALTRTVPSIALAAPKSSVPLTLTSRIFISRHGHGPGMDMIMMLL